MPFKDKETARAYGRSRYKAYYEANKEKLRAKSRAWYHANREQSVAKAKAWKDANPTRKQGHTRKFNLSKYGVSPEDYAAMLEHEGGVCAICGEPPPEGRALDIDHNGDRTVIRGLLCNPCNRGIAAFRDNPRHLAAAIVYLAERV